MLQTALSVLLPFVERPFINSTISQAECAKTVQQTVRIITLIRRAIFKCFAAEAAAQPLHVIAGKTAISKGRKECALLYDANGDWSQGSRTVAVLNDNGKNANLTAANIEIS